MRSAECGLEEEVLWFLSFNRGAGSFECRLRSAEWGVRIVEGGMRNEAAGMENEESGMGDGECGLGESILLVNALILVGRFVNCW